MSSTNTTNPVAPRSFRLLKVVQIPAILIGGILSVTVLSHSLRTFGADQTGAENLLSFLKLLASLIGLVVLALQCFSLWLMHTKRRSFRYWTNIYAGSSLVSKLIILILGVIFIRIFSGMAGEAFSQQDVFTQVMAGDVYQQEVRKAASQFFVGLLFFVLMSSVYPSLVLVLANRKSVRNFAESLETLPAYPPEKRIII